MTRIVRFHRGYAFAAAALFAAEVYIALFVRDAFVRPILGDVLAVMFVYCALLSVLKLRLVTAALIAFGIAVVIEIMQYLDVLTMLGLEGNRAARIVLGTTFTWSDILAYGVGAIGAIVIDKGLSALRTPHTQS